MPKRPFATDHTSQWRKQELRQFNRMEIDNIEKFGCQVLFVMGDSLSDSFAYTLGVFDACGLPEIVKSDNQDMSEMERMRRWAQTWKEYGPELERIRLREVRDEDNLLSLQLLARAFNQATRQQQPVESSGLVEMQRHLAKLSR